MKSPRVFALGLKTHINEKIICNYLIPRAITVRFPNLCPFTSDPGAELFEVVLLLIVLLLLLIITIDIILCCGEKEYTHHSLEGEDAEWEREHDADDCEYESKKRKRE